MSDDRCPNEISEDAAQFRGEYLCHECQHEPCDCHEQAKSLVRRTLDELWMALRPISRNPFWKVKP